MNVQALRKAVKGLRMSLETPKVIATFTEGQAEISPADLLDYFIEAIRLGESPKDDKLFPVLKNALSDPDQGLIFGCLRKLAQGIEPSIEDGDLFLPRGKQAKSILESTQRINLWYGSVRSSKTIMSLIKWLWRCLRGPKGRRMMVGNTSETLELNCIDPMRELLPAAVSFTTGWRHCIVFGRKVVLRGANDVGQEKKFRGPTLVDVYGDEITTWAKTIFKMILTRLSRPGAACFLTTNPDQPLHYLNTDYIERVKELSMTIWHFVLGDNPGLPEEYKADLIRENPPGTVYYLRFILGLWVAAEGRVYRFLTKEPKDGYIIEQLPNDFSHYTVGGDYGQQHPTVFLLSGYSTSLKKWIVIKEFYTNDKTNTVYAEEFEKEILKYSGGIVPEYIDIDPGGGGKALIKELREKFPTLDIREAQKSDVMKEIQLLASALFNHAVVIYRGCTRLINEMMSYLFDDKAKAQGIDKPLKQFDDGPDAFRYLWNRIRQDYNL
jgi:PBSX family phage terminase large subunit